MDRFDPPGVDRAPLRVLLIESSTTDAEWLREMLAAELPGAKVVVEASLSAGVRRLGEPFEVVITDLALPDAAGLEVLSAIQAERPELPVVVVSGSSDRALALSALGAGAEDYLVKDSPGERSVATAVLYALQRRAAEESRSRYERVALSLLDATEAPTCAVSGDGMILATNRAWKAFGRDNAGTESLCGMGRNYFEVCAGAGGEGEETAELVAVGLRALLGGETPRFELEYACPSPTQERWFSLRINPLPEGGAVLTHLDVSAAKRSEQALAHRSLHDTLTDLPNRALLIDRLGHALGAAEREGGCVGVGVFDLDHFKRINDSLGHDAGDSLLGCVADRLRMRVRGGDTLARFAGDEFVVVWPDLRDEGELNELALRLRSAVEEPYELGGSRIALTASLGVVLGEAHQSAEELIMAADAAMCDAKRHGRGGMRLYTPELHDDAEARLRIEVELQQALERREFVLHYQPVVDLELGQASGVEALVRWNHPDGMRMPDTFIPVAEASGLIVALGEWVIQEALNQTAAWEKEGVEIDIAVNFSARQITHPSTPAAIEGALRSSGVAPGRLLVEVTESAVMDDAEMASVVLNQIAELGVRIAIDDFGTGYSSLVYLKRYPITALKIDRSFVSGVGERADDDAIVASVVGLSGAVGAMCIAEGVETPRQWQILREMGCQLAQGYLFSRPVPAEHIPAALASCVRILSGGEPEPASASAELSPAVLARIEQMHTAGASPHTIAAALNQEGAPNPKGLAWRRSSVMEVLAARVLS